MSKVITLNSKVRNWGTERIGCINQNTSLSALLIGQDDCFNTDKSQFTAQWQVQLPSQLHGSALPVKIPVKQRSSPRRNPDFRLLTSYRWGSCSAWFIYLKLIMATSTKLLGWGPPCCFKLAPQMTRKPCLLSHRVLLVDLSWGLKSRFVFWEKETPSAVEIHEPNLLHTKTCWYLLEGP